MYDKCMRSYRNQFEFKRNARDRIEIYEIKWKPIRNHIEIIEIKSKSNRNQIEIKYK